MIKSWKCQFLSIFVNSLKLFFTVTLRFGRQLKFSFRSFPLRFVIRRQLEGETFKALPRSQSEMHIISTQRPKSSVIAHHCVGLTLYHWLTVVTMNGSHVTPETSSRVSGPEYQRSLKSMWALLGGVTLSHSHSDTFDTFDCTVFIFKINIFMI